MKGKAAINNLSMLKGAAEDDSDFSAGGGDAGGRGPHTFITMVDNWLAALPHQGTLPRVTQEQTSDAKAMPLERMLAREIAKGHAVIGLVINDLLMMK